MSTSHSLQAENTSLPAIRGFLETSFLDWPGRVCAVLFLGGCNFRCPFCHNHQLVLEPQSLSTVSFETINQRLRRLKKWLGGVCITGGEPTLDLRLHDLLKHLKKSGWQVKLDTNGSHPERIQDLLAAGLIDMIAMDVKAPLDQNKYNECAGTHVNLENIKQSIEIIKRSNIPYQFRMTVLPFLHSKEDILKWAETLGKGSSLKLQNFNPKTTMNPDYMLEKGFPPDSFDALQQSIMIS